MGYSWSELEEIFQNALKVPSSEREQFVINQAKNDATLQQTILMMLRDIEDADKYFEKLQEGIAGGLEENKVDIYQPGDVVGKYQIIRSLGRGGMGQVFLAKRNDSQFEQEVAIKCFAPDEVKNNFFENFRNEQQFLASLNHGAIAHILDGGISDDRIHYIIMEYVDGLPIDQYLKKHQLTTHEKLKLFLKIGTAINYAHNRLILHLDIKPSNIYINKDGQVKLLDFGIAQKMGEPLQQKHFLASPYYAAPEQLKKQTVSVATDIFQMGILLHLILSHELPFAKGEFPSSSNRKLVFAETKINKELQSIIYKCLQESPEDRYVSVSALFQDVESFLISRPVRVHKQNWSYRASKFIIRNRIKISLSVLLVMSMVLGIIFSSYQAKKARENELKVIKTNEFLLDIFKSADPSMTEGNLTVKEILDNSVNSIESKFEDKEFKLSLYERLINIYTNVYLWNDSRILAEDVLSRYRDVENLSYLKIMSTLGGNYRELSQYQKADSIFSILISEIETGNNYLSLEFQIENILAFAKSQQIQGNYDTALQIIHKAQALVTSSASLKDKADIYNHYASVNKDLSKYDSAYFYQSKAIKMIQAKESPDHQIALALYYNNQGNLLKDMSQYDSAIISFEKSISLKRKIDSKANLDLAITLSNLGGVYYKKKNYDSASTILNRAIDIFAAQLKPNNNFIVSTRYSLANIYYNQLKFERALSEYKEILAADTANFGPGHPYVADDYISIANCYRELNETDKAYDFLKKAELIIEDKFDESHQKTSYLYNKFGMLFEKQENYTMAQIYFQESFTLANKYLGEEHRYTKLYKEDVERISNIMKADIDKM
ncbi:serine/threonine protein kinase [Marivirga sericea]|uniref:Serine/threonine protein kinase n=1 Tax=Marivirga sericea TaxID=1028 RepID=A0A1X7KPF0_9BACT|nr:serine/threonine-protein kinase [Marivirga sericea]SMG43053.1 serine/threonine protein kinase [Marivirga sericea]